MQQNVQQMVRRIGFKRVAAARKIFAFLEQLAAKRQSIKLLLVRQVARRNILQRAKGRLPFPFPLLVKVWREPAEFPFAGGQTRVCCGEGWHVFEQRFEVARKQALKLSRRLVHPQSNARKVAICTREVRLNNRQKVERSPYLAASDLAL